MAVECWSPAAHLSVELIAGVTVAALDTLLLRGCKEWDHERGRALVILSDSPRDGIYYYENHASKVVARAVHGGAGQASPVVATAKVIVGWETRYSLLREGAGECASATEQWPL